MSKLDELIAELCPDGAEYVKLGDIQDRYRKHGNVKYSHRTRKFK